MVKRSSSDDLRNFIASPTPQDPVPKSSIPAELIPDEKEVTSQLAVEIPASLHREYKKKCVELGIPIKKVTIYLIEQFLKANP